MLISGGYAGFINSGGTNNDQRARFKRNDAER
jgi:hypothetical protein